MALTALRPTGNRIQAPARYAATLPTPSGYRAAWLDSGTSALALAILAAKARASCRHNQEVILPAYGCPDLVAAAQYAGVRAVLVDIQPDSPLYDYPQLQAAISPNTIAIVAATLLGIRPNEAKLREIIGDRPIALIEDSAQWFPRDNSQTFFGDSVVVSFGRGKPVNLLGGGALFTRDELPAEALTHVQNIAEGNFAQIKHELRRLAYNTLIQPAVYNAIERAPFLHIGATTFHALQNIHAMTPSIKRLLGSNLQQYASQDLRIQQQWRVALGSLPPGIMIDLCQAHDIAEDIALLRYPILIKNPLRRDAIYARLRDEGLGASTMYGRPLIGIEHVDSHACLFADDKNAADFSARLLTLPTHAAVSSQTIAQTIDIIRDCISND